MNEKQKELLTKIVNDKFSIGAFSGMIFNKYIDKNNEFTIKELIEEALNVRLKMVELVEDKQ